VVACQPFRLEHGKTGRGRVRLDGPFADALAAPSRLVRLCDDGNDRVPRGNQPVKCRNRTRRGAKKGDAQRHGVLTIFRHAPVF
jgi:hypothetical protein